MASLKELRNRIASVKATQKITKAMQMVAASKLRRAQAAAEAARPYAEKMSAVLANVSRAVVGQDGAPKLMVGTGSDHKHLLLVCTGERGLAGAFNSSIARLARDHANRLIREGKDVKFFCVGRKGYDVLRRLFASRIVEYMEFRAVRNIGFAEAEKVGRRVLELFDEGQFDVCTLYFSTYKSVISQIPTAKQIIPAEISSEAAAAGGLASYEYEPDEEAILTDLLPRNVSVQVLRAMLENNAGFYGAQMNAMDNATRNAGDMIGRYTLEYNRTRQAQITKELIEIISGAEAV
ncbi:MAG: F0F1 ATP synthase subunit gamma [Bauldia sp.]|nr:F0F1 ATP synthase subunit gamma [Bauldia sp.]